MGSERSLQEFLSLLSSPDVYPDIASAHFVMSPVLSLVSSILAYIGIVAMIFILLRIGADLLIMTGMHSIFDGNKGKRGVDFVSRFASTSGKESNAKWVGDPVEYVKTEGWKIIIMIAFVGLMVSGQLLPLAGVVTSSIGTAITRVASVDPAPYIKNVQFDTSTFQRIAKSNDINKLQSAYNSEMANMSSAYQAAHKNGIPETVRTDAMKAYATSYDLAEGYAQAIRAKQAEIEKFNNDPDRQHDLTDKDRRTLHLNTNLHNANFDSIFYEECRGAGGGGTVTLPN